MLDVTDAITAWPRQGNAARSPGPAVSPRARLADASAPARRVAVLIADGVKAEPVAMASAALTRVGAEARLIGTDAGIVRSIDGQEFTAHSTLESVEAERFDGLMLPDGDEAVSRLLRDDRSLDLIDAQCRLGKPIFVGSASVRMLDAAGVTASSRAPDRGFILGAISRLPQEIDEFVEAVLASGGGTEIHDAQ